MFNHKQNQVLNFIHYGRMLSLLMIILPQSDLKLNEGVQPSDWYEDTF